MKITKLGHCCLLIEEKGLRILTDPGNWTELPSDLGKIDVILITHEHQDHLHIDSLKTILTTSPQVEVVTNTAVAKLLDEAGIKYSLCKDDILTFGDVTIKPFETKHADIYVGIEPVVNTAFMIADRLFYPGDSFFNPNMTVEILALPVAGPWMHMREAIDYAKALKPRMAFPVHDGMLKHMGPFHFLPGLLLSPEGIKFEPLLAGGELDI